MVRHNKKSIYCKVLLRCALSPFLFAGCPCVPNYNRTHDDKRPLSTKQEVAGAQKIYQLLQFKADVSLVKANIAALEGRQQNEERQRKKVAQVAALKELAELKAEELRLKAAVSALETKREAYAAAAKAQ